VTFKRTLDLNVEEAARQRIRECYDRFDQVVVCYSGGKDSNTVLNLVLDVAEKDGHGKVPVIFRDEEAIPPPSIEYTWQVMQDPRIEPRWYAVPMKGQNACGLDSDTWVMWDDRIPEEGWIRPKPEWAIKELPGLTAASAVTQGEMEPHFFRGVRKSIVEVTGIRAQESMQRLQSVTRRVKDNWLAGTIMPNVQMARVIYDWSVEDVYRAHALHGWPLNPLYKMQKQYGLGMREQRLATSVHREGLHSLDMLQVLFPDFYERLLDRVPGAHTATLPHATPLYGRGKSVDPRREGESYAQAVERLLQELPEKEQAIMRHWVSVYTRKHVRATTRPLPEDEPDPESGVSWKRIAGAVKSRDLKGRTLPSMVGKSSATTRKGNATVTDEV